MSASILKKAALAAAFAAAFAATPAHAAFTLSDYTVDGGWFNTAESGRGATLDYLRTGVGTGVVFIALYTYDNAGNGIWLSTTVPVHETEFKKSGIPLYRYNGGNFGSPFQAPGAGVQVATLAYNFESCGSLKLDITPAAGQATLSPVSLTYNKGESATGNASFTCAYTQKFTACPAGTTAAPAAQERTCILSGTYNTNLHLTNDTTWVLSGLVKIGTRNTNAATITIDPGTRITGQGQTSDYLYVEPGSKIYANGLPYAPIVFTSPKDVAGGTPAPKDWGGIVVSGNAPTNCTGPCLSEFNTTLQFGGTDAAESSGVLRYVQSRYAGYIFAEGKEVNSFTFQGVGSGTVADYLQAYRGGDDAVEFFGGTNTVKHFVSIDGGDDGIDWDLGWSGKMQFALIQHSATAGQGQDRGIEAANSPTNSDATPRAIPTLSNLTLIGNGQGSHAVEFKQGSGGRIWNSVLSGFKTDCLYFANLATYTAAGTTPAALSGNTLVRNSFANCTTNFGNDATITPPYTTEAFYNANVGNSTASAQLTGFLPAANSPVQTAAAPVTVGGIKDDFFEVVPYAGAFGGPETNWTVGWTVGVNP